VVESLNETLYYDLLEKHVKMFDQYPFFLGLIVAGDPDRIAQLKKAIKENKPYDELKEMPKDFQKAYKRGDIFI
jgi:hypothetical protein|tara:strand:+ start:428 stop:649 length:222 start_codon:yes stop_codon:yes gene_type:complete